MANTILTPTQIVREAARQFMNNCKTVKLLYNNFQKDFKIAGQPVGQTINLRMPSRYVGTVGANLSVEDHVEWSRPFTVYPQFHVDVSFTSFERTFSVAEFGDRVLKSAMTTLANKVDYDALQMMKNYSPNMVGTPGTTPNTMLTIATAGAYMAQDAAPQNADKYLCLEPIAMATYFDAFRGLFQSSERIAEQYESGMVSHAAGFEWYMDQNVATHTVGPLGGTPLINGANQGLLTGVAEYTDIVTDGWTAAAATRLNRGDIITIAGVTAVQPVNRQSLNRLRQFTVSSVSEGNVSSDGAGNATIRIRPALIAGGQFQNVTARPADNAAITVAGAANTLTPQNIAFHREAFAYAMFPLVRPDGVDDSAVLVDPMTGISIRYARQWQIGTDAFPARFDIAYALGPYNPEWSCRIAG